MGNRLSRKKRPQAAVAAPAASALSLAVQSDLPGNGPTTQKDEKSAEKDDFQLPLSPRQAPPTARDADNNDEENAMDFLQHCYEMDNDPYTLYTQALLLKDQREFAAASELLRSLLSNASLSLEVHHHLAQCLLAQDPKLSWCREEVTKCLEHVVSTAKPLSNSSDASYSIMYRESLELLAHVLIAGRRFERALQLLDLLDELNANTKLHIASVAQRHQQALVGFQRAFCRYARGDPPDAISAELLRVLPTAPRPEEPQDQENDAVEEVLEDPLSGIELLLRADAVGLREGLALLAKP